MVLMLAVTAVRAELPVGDPERGRQVFQPCHLSLPGARFGNYNGPSLTGIFDAAGTRELRRLLKVLKERLCGHPSCSTHGSRARRASPTR
jgi:hypothetical protein